MKISDKTMEVLNNFSGINQSIVIRPGNVLRTGTLVLDIYASAKIEENFEKEIGISNLKKLLGVLSLFKGGSDPDIEFTDTHAVISSGGRKIQYTLGEKTLIKGAPDKDPSVPEAMKSVTLPFEEINNTIKAISVLDLSEVWFSVEKDGVYVGSKDLKNSSKDTYLFKLSNDGSETPFFVRVPKTSLKLMDRNYVLKLHTAYVKFESDDVSYWIPALAAE